MSIAIPALIFDNVLCLNVPNVCRGTGISRSHTPTSCGPVYFGSVRDSSAPKGDLRGTSCSFGGSGSARTWVVVARTDAERRRVGGGRSVIGEGKFGSEGDVKLGLVIVEGGVLVV